MSSIGADPDALDRLAAALGAAGSELESVARRVDVALGRTAWDGPDAERFRRSWRTAHRGQLVDGAGRCRSLARQASRSADEQRRASTSTGAPTRGSRLPALADAVVHRGTITGSFGLAAASLTGTLRIEEAGDRRRITYVEDGRAGVASSAGSGSRGHVGGLAAGRGASAGAEVGVQNSRRRTWEVDEDDVPGLLLALAAEDALGLLPTGALRHAEAQGIRFLDTAADLLGADVPDAISDLGTDGFGVAPRPDRTEDLLGIQVAAAVWARGTVDPLPGRQAADGAITGSVRAGTATEGDHRSLLLEADGAIAAGLVARIPGLTGGTGARGAGASTSIRIEVPTTDDGRPLLVTTKSSGPWTAGAGSTDDVVITRVAVDPVAGALAVAQVQRAIDRTMAGAPEQALAELARIRAPLAAQQIDQTVERIETSDAGLDVATPGASVSVDGSTTRHTVEP